MPRSTKLGHQFRDREDERGRARDVADQGESRPRGDAPEDRLRHLPAIADRERDLGDHDARAATVRGERAALRRGVVLVIVDEDLITGPEAAASAGRC